MLHMFYCLSYITNILWSKLRHKCFMVSVTSQMFYGLNFVSNVLWCQLRLKCFIVLLTLQMFYGLTMLQIFYDLSYALVMLQGFSSVTNVARIELWYQVSLYHGEPYNLFFFQNIRHIAVYEAYLFILKLMTELKDSYYCTKILSDILKISTCKKISIYSSKNKIAQNIKIKKTPEIIKFKLKKKKV